METFTRAFLEDNFPKKTLSNKLKFKGLPSGLASF